jgi:phytol kinase
VADPLHDLALTLLALAGAGALVLLSRTIARSGRIAPELHRKALHAAVGFWTLVLTPWFHHLAWALGAPVLFTIVNASGKARELMPGMARTPREARGLWTFPLAVALTYLLFWEESPRPAILAGVAALALADPAAYLVGSRWGQRRLRGAPGGRTLEGSLAFLVVAAISAGLVASTVEGGAFPWRMGIGCGLAGALVEALTPSGWDNLTIPLGVAVAYRLLA